MKKRLVVLAAALSMSMGLSMVSYAGNWQHDSKGTWYLTDDYKYPVSQWKNIDGNWYYFNTKGYTLTGWQWVDGKAYFFNDGRNSAFDFKSSTISAAYISTPRAMPVIKCVTPLSSMSATI